MVYIKLPGLVVGTSCGSAWFEAMCETLSSVHSPGIQYERPCQSDERSTIKKNTTAAKSQALIASTEAMFYKRFTMDAPNKSNTHS